MVSFCGLSDNEGTREVPPQGFLRDHKEGLKRMRLAAMTER